MNKDEFNKLSVTEQVNEINKLIKEFGSATKAIQFLGYNESTLRKRFKKNGYEMNNNKTAYISIDNKSETNVMNEDKTKTDNNSETNVSENKEIIEMLKWYKSVKDKNEIIESETKVIKINTGELEEQAITRGIKIYPTIFNKFKNFCTNNKEYKMQDLISMALLEYINRYEK